MASTRSHGHQVGFEGTSPSRGAENPDEVCCNGWVRAEPTEDLLVIVVEALDNAWEPLVERLAGITQTEYDWQPAADAWTVRDVDGAWVADWADPDPDPAPVTTIAWRCWHIAVDCLDSYSARLFGQTGTGLTGTAWVGDSGAAVELLGRSWQEFRSGVSGWDASSLLEPLGPSWGPFANHSNLDLALHATREIVHHGAEIALLRDLYRATATDRTT